MTFQRILLISLILFTSYNGNSQNNMISLSQIEEMYSIMHSNGINTDKELLYSYFFTNKKPNKLKNVATVLENKGFTFVEIYLNEDGEFYWLHVEKVGIHNAQSLFELNKSFYAIANKYKLRSYDGFDVGNKDKNKPIDRNTYVVAENFEVNDIMKEDMPYLIILNIEFDHFPHKEEFSYFIEIVINYNADNSGLPSEKDLHKLAEFETFIETNLTKNNISNYYLGRTTHKGLRKSYFVTSDITNTKGLFEFIQSNSDEQNFEFQIIKDKEWTIYKKMKQDLN